MNAAAALHVLPAYRAWTPSALAQRLGTSSDIAQRKLQCLARRGLARPCLVIAYQLTPEGVMAAKERREIPKSPIKPRPSSPFRQRVWSAARMLEKFTVADVLELAAGPSGASAEEQNARRYLNALHRAGVLRRLRAGHSARNARYFLVRDLGPQAPVFKQREHAIYDLNAGRLWPCRRTQAAGALVH